MKYSSWNERHEFKILLERFVEAHERIAEAMEKQQTEPNSSEKPNNCDEPQTERNE